MGAHRLRIRRATQHEAGQVLVVFAITAAALLGVIGLLYSFGLVLAERRTLQTAADAASLSGAWQVLSELQSDDRSDARVRAAVQRYASDNSASTVSYEYVAADGTVLPNSEPFNVLARGVRVTVDGSTSTVLPGLVGMTGVSVSASATARAQPTASPGPASLVLPLAIAQASYAPHAQVDLFAGRRLDLTTIGATTTGVTSTNLQFWSDGQHNNGSIAVNSDVSTISGTYNDSLAAGLADNIRRQNLRDASNRAYGIVSVALYDTATSASVHVVGFARLKLLGSDVSLSAARGMFVPYPAAAYGTPPPAGSFADFGAALVGLVS
jgi:Flp pilus assembly protein TadG